MFALYVITIGYVNTCPGCYYYFNLGVIIIFTIYTIVMVIHSDRNKIGNATAYTVYILLLYSSFSFIYDIISFIGTGKKLIYIPTSTVGI